MTITDLQNCRDRPCNKGDCEDLPPGGVHCDCPYGFGGKYCESKATLLFYIIKLIILRIFSWRCLVYVQRKLACQWLA